MKRCPELVQKECRKCHRIKPIHLFHLNGFRRKDGTSATRNDCKSCNTKAHDEYVLKNRDKLNAYMCKRGRRSNDKEKSRDSFFKRKYGISTEIYNEMFKAQNGLCAICNEPQTISARNLDVDHCHETGIIRGLCCIRCNRGLGLLRDNVEVLQTAINYLKKYKN